jgi:hypothetical protein
VLAVAFTGPVILFGTASGAALGLCKVLSGRARVDTFLVGSSTD